MKRDPAVLMVGLFLVVLASALFFVAYRLPTTSDLYQVCAFLMFLVAVTALSTLVGFVDGPPAEPVDPFTEVKMAFLENLAWMRGMDTPESSNRWEPSLKQLTELDPVLALSKLRIDMESELQRISEEHGLAGNDASMGDSKLRKLMGADILQPALANRLQDAFAACSAAIHGRPLAPAQLDAAIQEASRTLASLREVKAGPDKTP